MNSPHQKPPRQNHIIFLSSLGGAFELYDFVIYIYLISYLSQVFFPLKNSFLSTLSMFAVFALGYIVRPIGGIIFGHFGDRVGRKKMFVLSILLMSIPILLVGLLPSVQTIGVSATVLFVCLRVIQGLAIGGEIPGAMTFTCEYVDASKRGYASASIYCGLNYGITLAALVVALITSSFSTENILSFAWRLPFLFGALLGGVAVYLRSKVEESPLFSALKQKKLLEKIPLKTLLHKHLLAVVRSFLITLMGSMLIVVCFTYIKPYLTLELHYSVDFASWLVVIVLFLSSTLQIYFGSLSDRIGRKHLLFLGSLLLIILSYPLYFIFTLHIIPLTILAMLLMGAIAAIIIGIYPCVLIEMFPTNVRFSGYAFSYNIAFALAGGLVPLSLTYFIHEFHFLALPGIYLLGSGILGTLGLIGLPSSNPKEL